MRIEILWATQGFPIRSQYNGGATHILVLNSMIIYSGADKSLARPGRKQATATEDYEFQISYL